MTIRLDTNPATSDGRKAAAAASIAVVLWASAFVAIRDAGHALSPGPLALIRLAVAAAALTIPVLSKHRVPPMPRSARSWWLVVAFGVLWLAGYTVALNAAERHIDAGTAALLVNLAPLLVAVGAGKLLGEGFSPALVLGCVTALSGLVLIAAGSTGHRDWIGVALGLVAALLYATGVLIQKVALRKVDGLTMTWLGCVIATVVLLPWTPQLVAELQAAPAGAILGAVYLGLFPTAIGFTMWAYALRRTDASRLAATTYAVPAVSILLSWMLLNEVPTPYGLVGGALCLLGVAISRRRPGARTP